MIFSQLFAAGSIGHVAALRRVVAIGGRPYLNKHLNEVLQTDQFKKPMAELGMAPPPAADNTLEKFEKFFRDEVARQGVLAELMGRKITPPK